MFDRHSNRTRLLVQALMWLALPFWALVWYANRDLSLPKEPLPIVQAAPLAPPRLLLRPPWECRRLAMERRQSLLGCPNQFLQRRPGRGLGDFPLARPVIDGAFAGSVRGRPSIFRFGEVPATGGSLGAI